MRGDLVKRSLMIAERLREARFGWPFYVEREALDEAATALEAQADEITRLRAEVATARREGMEEAAKIALDDAKRLDGMAELSPYPHVKREHEGRSWVAQKIAAAIRAAAGEDRQP